MESTQFRVSFPIGTKLLTSIVVLLLIVISFLSVSAILLVSQDRRAYTYQAQSTEALLAGKNFAESSRHGLDTLRVALGSMDPLRPNPQRDSAALQSLIQNQSELFHLAIALANPQTQAITPLTQVSKPEEAQRLELSPESLKMTPELLRQAGNDLLKSGFAFINLSRGAHAPILGLILADLKLKDNPRGMPVALGMISLAGFAEQLGGTNLTIGTRTGSILYDTDPSVLFSSDKDLRDDALFQAALSSKVSSGAYEHHSDTGERYLGSYSLPGMDLVVLAKTDWQKAMRSTYALTEKVVLLGLMGIGGAIIFAIFFSKSLTSPIDQLYEATREVSKGNFSLDLKPKGRDEISALTLSFNAMSGKISELIEESMKKVQLENELAIASTVQQTLIPPPRYADQQIEIRSHYQSASQCGGDWWGFFGSKDKLCVMIADATGHGLPSALITASARACFSVMQQLSSDSPGFSYSPSAMLSYAHRVIYDASQGKVMMTFFMGVIDFTAGTITYSSAGHNPPWLFKKDANGFKLKSLTAVGQRLGDGIDVPKFEEKTAEIAPGDLLFLYTDGLMEGKNLEGEMYGKKRSKQMVEAQLAGGPDRVIDTLVEDFLKHNQSKPLDDDLTLAVAKILTVGGRGQA